MASLAEQVTSKLYLSLAPAAHETFKQSLKHFLQSTYDRPSPGAIAFVDKRVWPVRPILDVYVLWSRPIELSSDAQEMRDVAADHAVFSLTTHEDHDTLLNIVDPRRYPSPEHLRNELIARFGLAPGGFITCAQLQR